jgi:hypothetical protein
MGKKKIYLLIIISAFLVLIFSSCFVAKTIPQVSGYAQYYDGSLFSKSDITVTLSLITPSSFTNIATVTTDSKGYYYFSNVTKPSTSEFYSLVFTKGSKTNEFEIRNIPFFSNMTTISSATCGTLTIKATHTTSDMKSIGFEVKRSDGVVFFSRPFQWYDSTGYSDYVDSLPYGSYTVTPFYLDSESKVVSLTSIATIVTLSSTKNYIDIPFDLSK